MIFSWYFFRGFLGIYKYVENILKKGKKAR